MLVENVKDEHLEKLIALEASITSDDMGFCANYVHSLSECTNKVSNKIKYLVVLNRDEVYKVKVKQEFIKVLPFNHIEAYLLNKLEIMYSDTGWQKLDELYLGDFESAYLSEHEISTSTFSPLTSDPTTPGDEFPAGHNGSRNYCGSEDGDVPDYFPTSCHAHDMCYAGSSPKSLCDADFLDNMVEEIDSRYPSTAKAFFLGIAETYFEGVTHLDAAFNAYCANKSASVPECREILGLNDKLQHNNDTRNGTRTGGGSIFGLVGVTGAGTFTSKTYECEIWEFPDGNGGTYQLARNCKLVS